MANNLNISPDTGVEHPKLAGAYEISGGTYTLAQIVLAVAGVEAESAMDDSDPKVAAWNARTVTDRLAAINTYLKDTGATAIKQETTETPPQGVGGEQGEAPVLDAAAFKTEPLPSVEARLDYIEKMLGIRR